MLISHINKSLLNLSELKPVEDEAKRTEWVKCSASLKSARIHISGVKPSDGLF